MDRPASTWSRASLEVFSAGVGRHQRSDAGKHRQNVAPGRAALEVPGDRLQQEVDLLRREALVRAARRSSGVSVVPTRVCPCQGMAKITRPSGVLGTIIAVSLGKNERSSTTWAPWLGRIRGGASGCSIWLIASLNGPAALTTERAKMSIVRAGFHVAGDGSRHAAALMLEPFDLHVIDAHGPFVDGGLHQVYQQPRVVEARIEVPNAAASPLRLSVGMAAAALRADRYLDRPMRSSRRAGRRP